MKPSYEELEARCAALAAENGQMLRLLTDISENHDEYVNQDEYLYAGIPMDYVSEINMYVSRDVEADNPFKETDAYLAEVRAKARREGAHFVANRMLAAWDAGFIDDTAKNVADIARMILTSTEFMADAPEGDFARSFAAMFQGGNSPVVPDGSEDTKRLDWLDAQNKRLNEYHGTSYGWKFDANFQRNAMMLNDSNYPVMTVRQAIDEAIAAAPQQESV